MTVASAFEIKHWHYRRLDPAEHPEPAIFKVHKAGVFVAVVREPFEAPLIGEPVPLKNYRVDCRETSGDLKAFLADYFPTRTFVYFESPAFTWNVNGTSEEMPWGQT